MPEKPKNPRQMPVQQQPQEPIIPIPLSFLMGNVPNNPAMILPILETLMGDIGKINGRVIQAEQSVISLENENKDLRLEMMELKELVTKKQRSKVK